MQDKEKKEWLKSIGAVEFDIPVKYTYGFQGYGGCFNLSEEYVRDTPLEKLKESYESSKEFVRSMLSNGMYEGIFVPMDLQRVEEDPQVPVFPDP